MATVVVYVGYCRVSTTDQALEGVSLDAQRARIASWCAAAGGQLDPADVFEDAGISGKRADKGYRPDCCENML